MQAKLCTILQNVYIVSHQRCMHVCQEAQEQCYNSIQRTIYVKDCHLKLVRLMGLSVFLRLWLCYASKTLHNPTKRLYRFLSTLYACLSRSARAVLQFYPENGEQVKDCHLKLVRLMGLSVFLRLWLCYASKTLHNPTKRLYRFLSTLYACLSRSARAVLQFYPENGEQVKDCHLKLVRLMGLSVFLRLWLCYASKTLHNPTKRLYRFLSTLYACLSRSARAVLQFYPENGEQVKDCHLKLVLLEPRESRGKREKKTEDSKPSSGKISLFDFLEDKLPVQPESVETTNLSQNSYIQINKSNQDRFESRGFDNIYIYIYIYIYVGPEVCSGTFIFLHRYIPGHLAVSRTVLEKIHVLRHVSGQFFESDYIYMRYIPGLYISKNVNSPGTYL
ncbi:uncharacterized protein [Temnothorax longispinosus]|uniref:uncharacterized protein isoform X2 n=1 Tax=Temnothorax longispinosus TaxID=300112 RepID=UPI003A98CF26